MDETVLGTASRWAACFPDGVLEHLGEGVAKGLLMRMQMGYESDELLLDSLSYLLAGKPISRWDDGTVTVFDREVHDVVRQIEESALVAETALPDDTSAAAGLAALVQGRIGELFDRLVGLVGLDRATTMVSSVSSSSSTGARHGDNAGSPR